MFLCLLLLVFAGLTAGSLEGWPTFLLLMTLVFVLVLGALFGWLGGLLGGLVSSVYGLFRTLTKEMPEKNYYGICTGRKGLGFGEQKALTDWLSEQIDHLAGKKGKNPLTLRDLAGKKIEIPGEDEPVDVGITLKMVTTNLSHGEPYVLPMQKNTFLFKEAEMRDLFPEEVVRYMVEAAYESERIAKLPPGYYF